MRIATLTCPNCGRSFDLTDEYVARYGGRTTACACGAALHIPTTATPDETATSAGAARLSYASPPDATGAVWQSRGRVVLRHGAALPDRCVKCNRPADGVRVRVAVVTVDHAGISQGTAFWMGYRPRRFLLELFRHRQWTTISLGLCRAHRVRRWVGQTLLWIGLAFSGVVLSGLVFGDLNGYALPLGLLGICGSILAFILLAQAVEAESMGSGLVVLKRAGRPFVQSLPVDGQGTRADTNDDVAARLGGV